MVEKPNVVQYGAIAEESRNLQKWDAQVHEDILISMKVMKPNLIQYGAIAEDLQKQEQADRLPVGEGKEEENDTANILSFLISYSVRPEGNRRASQDDQTTRGS